MIGRAFSKASIYISSLHLTVVAVDRYETVVHPFAYEDRMTDGVVRALLAAAWIVGCLLCLLLDVVHRSHKTTYK